MASDDRFADRARRQADRRRVVKGPVNRKAIRRAEQSAPEPGGPYVERFTGDNPQTMTNALSIDTAADDSVTTTGRVFIDGPTPDGVSMTTTGTVTINGESASGNSLVTAASILVKGGLAAGVKAHWARVVGVAGIEFVASSQRLHDGSGARHILSEGYLGGPEGVVVAEPGSLYLDVNGGAGATLWVKESGSGDLGWVAK